MTTETACILVAASTAILSGIWLSDYLGRRKRERAVGTATEERMRFSVWIFGLPEGTNMDEALAQYTRRYAKTFSREENETDDAFNCRIRIGILEGCLSDFEPTLRKGVENLLFHYRCANEIHKRDGRMRQEGRKLEELLFGEGHTPAGGRRFGGAVDDAVVQADRERGKLEGGNGRRG